MFVGLADIDQHGAGTNQLGGARVKWSSVESRFRLLVIAVGRDFVAHDRLRACFARRSGLREGGNRFSGSCAGEYVQLQFLTFT
jgi:glutamine amidotransferase-like uncharacterized protein